MGKQKSVCIYVKETEWNRIKSNAEAYGFSFSRYMVIAALNFKPGYKPVNQEAIKQ